MYKKLDRTGFFKYNYRVSLCTQLYSEVTHTDRQKYMAELSKLLTFMFKEDRAEILAHYNEMFDNAEDEEALMREFGSPTKLAVSISRSYDRDERKLSVNADEKGDAETAVRSPVPQQAVVEKPKEKSSEEYTGTYAEIVEEFRRQRALEEGTEYTPIFFDEPTEAANEPETVEEVEAAEETSEEAAPEADKAPESEETEGAEPEVEETEAEEAVAEDEPTEARAEEETVEEEAEPEEAEEAPEEAEEAPEEVKAPIEEPEPVAEEPQKIAVAKTNVFLLILYLILAIPVGIVGIVLVIVLGAAAIIAAAVAAALAIKLFSFAFSGFVTLFADIFMSGGVGLIAAALAILLLWLGVWGIAAGVPGIVKGLRSLGRELCVKEVYVNG